jgi:tetratricopeptide (TPR) repeat protein
MKKVVFASMLVLATSTLGSAPMLFAQDSAQSGQLTIKDPAEYNDYTNAVGQSTPAAKAAAIEAFLTKYPNSVVKNDLLETLMVTYQQAGDTDKTLATAQRVLQADPNNLRALYMTAFLDKTKATAAMQTNPSAAGPLLDDGASAAQKGLNATKPASMADADFQKLKTAASPVFYEVIALDDQNKKDIPGAVQNFTSDLKAYSDPAQTTSGLGLNDTYLLGQAYAQQTPPDLKNAAWFLTRAALFAPPAAKQQIQSAAEYFYKKYHGSMDGYPQVQALAQANLFPPADYNPTPAPPPPSPADLAAQTVASTPDLKTLSVSDREFILFNGKPEDAQKVWDVMKGQRVEFPGKVISASPTQVLLAVTEDNQQSNKADFTINMKTPLKTPPTVGANATFDATFDSYTTTPPMITLIDGAPPAKAAAPVHHHKATQ